jgi:hypothetical protein
MEQETPTTVYVVLYFDPETGDFLWVERVFSSKLDAEEYCGGRFWVQVYESKLSYRDDRRGDDGTNIVNP